MAIPTDLHDIVIELYQHSNEYGLIVETEKGYAVSLNPRKFPLSPSEAARGSYAPSYLRVTVSEKFGRYVFTKHYLENFGGHDYYHPDDEMVGIENLEIGLEKAKDKCLALLLDNLPPRYKESTPLWLYDQKSKAWKEKELGKN